MRSSVIVANVLAWMMAATAIAAATDAPSSTSIAIKGMHCAACAKKVAKKLNGVSHVKSASVDHEQAAALIVPIDGKEISPKALWEAVEATGYKPTELKGPSGTFKKKPAK